MSEVDIILRAPCEGFRAAGICEIEAAPPTGMITLRGDLSDAALGDAVREATGFDVPAVRKIAREGARGVAWMSPDELLLITPYEEAPAIAARIGGALAGTHHLAVVVSDARAVFRLTGAGAREVLAKGAPVDLAPEAFGQGDFRRTRLEQMAAAFGMTGPDTFDLICFRSVGAHMAQWLEKAVRARVDAL